MKDQLRIAAASLKVTAANDIFIKSVDSEVVAVVDEVVVSRKSDSSSLHSCQRRQNHSEIKSWRILSKLAEFW